MKYLLVFTLFALMTVPFIANAQNETDQYIHMDDESVIGEINNPLGMEIFRHLQLILVDSQNIDRRLVETIEIVDKEVFENSLRQ